MVLTHVLYQGLDLPHIINIMTYNIDRSKLFFICVSLLSVPVLCGVYDLQYSVSQNDIHFELLKIQLRDSDMLIRG